MVLAWTGHREGISERESAPMTSVYDIDLVSPEAVLELLGIGEAELLGLVNAGRLAAYDLDGVIRFRAIEVAELTAELVA